jgi:hypothetical protein
MSGHLCFSVFVVSFHFNPYYASKTLNDSITCLTVGIYISFSNGFWIICKVSIEPREIFSLFSSSKHFWYTKCLMKIKTTMLHIQILAAKISEKSPLVMFAQQQLSKLTDANSHRPQPRHCNQTNRKNKTIVRTKTKGYI